ncbi:MAG: inositol 2-dehydrogenase [Betaproteobacteria bacterium]|nr:inositol 2-dehydrogenase [Betaproteobacteria bacterium]
MFNVAMMGVGRMGSIHARNIAANARLTLKYVVDHQPEAAARFASELGAEAATLDHVLGDASIRAVFVASPTSTHLDLTLACLRAGKAVFCEKPLDLDLAKIRAARAELALPAAPLFVAFNRRFDPHFRALQARIEAGAIGVLESLHLVNHDPLPAAHAFIPTSGGLFKDFTIHDFDMARWLLGEPVSEVFAWASCLIDPVVAELGDVDTAKLVLRTASGKLCLVSNNRRTGYGYDQRIEAFGAKGALRVDNLHTTALGAWGAQGMLADRFPFAFIDRYADAYRAEVDHFADVLEGKAAAATGYRASVESLVLAEAAAESVRRRAAVAIPAFEE